MKRILTRTLILLCFPLAALAALAAGLVLLAMKWRAYYEA